MEDRIAGRDAVDIREIGQGHRQKVAMGQHGALGTASRAAGVEQPGDVVRAHFGKRDRLALAQRQMVAAADLDDPLQ